MKSLDAATVPLQGINLVEASAGTGKTHTLVTLYLRLVTEVGLSVSSILVVTYTRAATAELRDRIRERLSERVRRVKGAKQSARLERALRDFDQAAIFTIHGFCQRALQDEAFESRVPFRETFLQDDGPLVRDVIADFWARLTYKGDPALVALLWKQGLAPKDEEDPTESKLLALARRVGIDPSITVLPEGVPAAFPSDAESQWRELADEALAHWSRERDAVEKLLSGTSVNRSKYQEARRKTDLASIERILSGRLGSLNEEALETLQRLGPSWLNGKMNGRSTLPSLHVLQAIQAAHDFASPLGAEATLATLLRCVDVVRSEVPKRKARAGVQSYDDLLRRLDAALEGAEGEPLVARLRSRFQASLIDEFQDTDPTQYRIFRRLFGAGDRPVFLIGDPKQAIYGFRGADVFAYLRAAPDAGSKAWTLSTNYRSDPSMVRAVNTVFSRVSAPFLLHGIAFRPVDFAPDARGRLSGSEEALRIHFCADDSKSKKGDAEARIVLHTAASIVQLLSEEREVEEEGRRPRRLLPKDIAVLCRTNDQARSVQEALRDLEVPTVRDGDSSVLDTDDAGELQRVLIALALPGDFRALRSALVTRLLGVTGHELYAMGDPVSLAETTWDAWVAWARDLNACWNKEGFVRMFRRLLETREVPARLLRLPGGERRLTNLMHLGELLHEAATRDHLGPLALLQWLSEMRADVASRAGLAHEDMQVRLESDADAVKLTTIHRSKGLEYPVVFCPFLWGADDLSQTDLKFVKFHDPNDGNRAKLDVGSENRDAHCTQARYEAAAEGLRLLYVALTRARHRTEIVAGHLWGYDKSALAYVLHAGEWGTPEKPLKFAHEQIRTRCKTMGVEEFRSDLMALAEVSRGSIQIVDLEVPSVTPYAPASEQLSLLAHLESPKIHRRFRVTSFSALVREEHKLSPLGARGVDADERIASEGEGDEGPASTEASGGTGTLGWATFPAGARAGLLVHSILEHLDFRAEDEDALRDLVRRSLPRYGFETHWEPIITAGLKRALAAPLPTLVQTAPFALREVSSHDRLNELEFIYPVGDASGGSFLASELARVLANHGAPRGAPSYAERLERLGFWERGFLRGFIDLVFRHDRRWYVADYKTNHLGGGLADYAPAKLAQAMIEHDYILQYHLYTLALHRFLRSRDPSYDYEEHFGGIYYLFLRGMGALGSSDVGVFSDRPTKALIDDMDAVLAGRNST